MLPNLNNGALWENSQQPKHIDCFVKTVPQQTSDWSLNADPTRKVVNVGNVGCGWKLSAWNSWPQPGGVQGSG